MHADLTRFSTRLKQFRRVIAGAAIIAALGLSASAADNVRPATTAAGANQSALVNAALHAPTADYDARMITKAGHRYHQYLAEGINPQGYWSYFQGAPITSPDYSNHRHFMDEAAPEPGNDGHPENHRVGQQAD